MILVLILNICSTLYMTGLIWFVQVVHYPLHGQVGESSFQVYQSLHMERTSWVVIPPMLTELITTGILFYAAPFGISKTLLTTLLVLLVLIWLSTGLIQAPTHGLMLSGFSEELHQRLVSSNWIRTVFWTARTVILMVVLTKLLPASVAG